MKSRRVLITGGAGFIGSNLARNLCRDNQVTILDDLSSGSLENLREILDQVNFIQGSIVKNDTLENIFRGMDVVVHLAAIASVNQSIENPALVNDVNITGTLNVLIAARNNKVKKFVFASSAAVYGNQISLPIKETAVLDPQSPYAVTKITGEYYCDVFNKIFDLQTTCLRYFNVFGPKQNPNSHYSSVISKFISLMSQDKQPTIFGDGTQTRDFVFINDIVDATIKASESDLTGVFNVGSGSSTTINALAKDINLIMGKKLQPKIEEPKAGDIKHSLADISKIKTLGFNPCFPIKKGLEEIIREIK